MKKILFLLLLGFAIGSSFAQPGFNADIRKDEKNLERLSEIIVNGVTENERAGASFAFIPALVKALKVEGSFEYPFDSLKTISILYPEDRSFRIFTWQLSRDNGAFRYYGAIQMNTPELQLFPLFDYSDSLYNPIHETLTNDTWLGTLYYNVLAFGKKRGKKYYLLFGWDGNDRWSTKKVLDILHFEEGKPVFGAPLLVYDTDSSEYTQHRLILEYKKDAGVLLNYIPEEEMIIYDHLIAPDKKMEDLSFTYIPDGTYEGFELHKKGFWKHVDKVFHYSIDEFDNPPVPKPVDFDEKK